MRMPVSYLHRRVKRRRISRSYQQPLCSSLGLERLRSDLAEGPRRKRDSTAPDLEYDKPTFQKDEQRLRDLEVAGKQDLRIGAACLAGTIVFLDPGVLVHRKNREKRTTQLIYDLSDSAKAQQEEVERSLGPSWPVGSDLETRQPIGDHGL